MGPYGLFNIYNTVLILWLGYGLYSPEKAIFWNDQETSRGEFSLYFLTVAIAVSFLQLYLASPPQRPERQRSSTTDNTQDIETRSQSEGSEDKGKHFGIGDTFGIGRLAYRIDSVYTQNTIDGALETHKAGPTATFLVVSFVTRNDGEETIEVSPDDLMVVLGTNRRKFSPSDATIELSTPQGQEVIGTELQPGVPQRLKLAFKLPTNALEEQISILATDPKSPFGEEITPENASRVIVSMN